MKRKEIKALAKKIAHNELILQNPNSSKKQVELAKKEINNLISNGVKDFKDIDAVDEAVQDILNKKI